MNKLRSLTNKQNVNHIPVATNKSSSNEDVYEVPDYATITEVGEKRAYVDNDIYTEMEGDYTELDEKCTPGSTKSYQTLLKDPVRAQDEQVRQSALQLSYCCITC